jgi:glutamate dehydrogenase
VSRGGLRWSERLEDYRTEILGLLKAQIVKNAVIVPEGAKGGFVAKALPDDPDARRAEVVACYRLFVSGLLALTDDLVGGEVRHPAATRCLDGDDPYLVVAADKGTATFSDLANEIAGAHGFWLGDAFASGGSNGYDHKAMGITARGAWESVLRHFRELGHDIATEPFTVVGIGDMSGDVFGNGMLLSDRIKLIAAFDHRHVFIDPDPDPTVSYAERQRLFALPGSSWGQYDRSLLSFGGAIHQRSAKSITLSETARLALGVETAVLTPDEVISAILRAPVDLLWNGGIGTYVKGSHEAHLDVGDKANDAIRVDGCDVRARIIGEGGNLGLTQRGRVEFARNGGRVFTDAIDNSAGVDCSDHEVNIKILLDGAVARGELTPRDRNELLVEMTDEVAELVLAHNRSQTLALSVACVQARLMTDVHARYIHDLEAAGLLSRELEALPDAEELAERRLAGEGLTAPELAVLLAVGKNRLSAELVAGDAPDLPSVAGLASAYFPTPLRERFRDGIESHPLRREIIANRIANSVLDRAGTTMVHRLAGETGASSQDLALAHLAAWRVFDLEPLWQQAAALGHDVDAATQIDALLAIRRLGERATRWFVRHRSATLDPGVLDAEFGATTRATTAALADLVTGTARRDVVARVRTATAAGIAEDLAWRLAVLEPAIAVLDIVEVANGRGLDAASVASEYFAVGAALELYWLHDRIDDLPRTTRWEALARLSLRGDLESVHARIADAVAATLDAATGDPVIDGDRAADAVDRWIADRGAAATRYLASIADLRAGGRTELAALLVACGELAELAP